MRRAGKIRVWSVLAAGAIALAALLGLALRVATQDAPASSSLLAANPAPNELLAAAPDRIALTFTKPIDPENASVRLLRSGGEDLPLSPAEFDASNSGQVVARPLARLDASDYVVIWSARTVDNGALLAGAYPFRTGVAENPGAAQVDDAWPQPWAAILRWLVFLGTAMAAGGFTWARLITGRPGARAEANLPRGGTMAIFALIALIALIATILLPLIGRFLTPASERPPLLLEWLRAMPLGWWVQLVAISALSLLCLGVVASGRIIAALPAAVDSIGLGSGLAALAGLSLTSHAASQSNEALAWEIVHQWSSALWVSGLLYLAAGWRGLGSDVARFRTVRWIGGLLFAMSVVTGLGKAWQIVPAAASLFGSRYGQVLTGKGAVILAVVVLGALVMAVPRRSTALRVSGSLGMQSGLALVAAGLAALLALMAAPGTVALVTLAGVDLADVVPVDRAAFDAERGTIHLLTQPANFGTQTLVVRLTGSGGAPLISDPAPQVQVSLTPFDSSVVAPADEVSAILQPDASGSVFSGAVTLPAEGWWQADVAVTPPDGIASRARFWLVLPDPNVTGSGPTPETDSAARTLYEQGLQVMTALRSVRSTQRLGDGTGSLHRSRTAVSAAEGERPAAYSDAVIDINGNVVAQQTIVGDRRWILVDGTWVEAAPRPFTVPAAWGESYADATGFQFGPREDVDGELCQVVTFWQPARANPSRAPAWFAWWIGLASGAVRQEAMISARHYMVYRFSDFDAPLGIEPPLTPATPAATPRQSVATVAATPAAVEQP